MRNSSDFSCTTKIAPHRRCCCSGEILNLAEFSTSTFCPFNSATRLLLRFFGVFLPRRSNKKEFIASTVTTTAWQRFSWRIHHQGRKIRKKRKQQKFKHRRPPAKYNTQHKGTKEWKVGESAHSDVNCVSYCDELWHTAMNETAMSREHGVNRVGRAGVLRAVNSWLLS